MKTPKKIYMPNELLSEEWTMHIEGEDVEYTRTDAFIEKACEYLIDYEFNDSPTIADRRKIVDEFRKYMKGE